MNAATLHAATLHVEDRVARLTLNRPERHNALVPELLDAIREQLARVRDSDAAVLILDANGRSFSSGGDVAGFFDTPGPNAAPTRREW